jgi:fructan beta-fructosidase
MTLPRLALGAFAVAALLACAEREPLPETLYQEAYRPQFHFTPVKNWMNDPNGLVFFDGEYHLFYQYNPFGIRWGHMSWGHAVSPDLVRWEHLPVAIPEKDGVMIFSGSVVVDWKNSSGFGRNGAPPLVAVYTGHRERERIQTQDVAFSNDRGRTWAHYEKNPVLDRGLPDFRDPKVFWHEAGPYWVMVLALPADRKVSFYSSRDLKQWNHLSDFGPAGAVESIWEVPDLFQLPVEGEPGQAKWVLTVSIGADSRGSGSACQYFVGHFDGKRFVAENDGPASFGRRETTTRWVDYGRDFYAAISFSDIPPEDGRRIWLGWLNNWQYGQDLPTDPWRGAQSIPRELKLKRLNGRLHLVQQPVAELAKLRGEHLRLSETIVEGTFPLEKRGMSGKGLEIQAVFEPGTASEFGLKVRVGKGEETLVGYDTKRGMVFVDRTRSGRSDFHPKFADRHSGPLAAQPGRIRLHIFVDRSSVEAFAGEGETVLTDLIFPSSASQGLELFASGGSAKLVRLDVWKLRSIWDETAP